MSKLLLPESMRSRDAQTALHKRAEDFERQRIASFAVVTVYENGEVNCDFDVKDKAFHQICLLGEGVKSLYSHLQTMAAQVRPL